MWTVHEVSRMTGLSVRTLHYYDEIGLLHPSTVTEAGYRMYDEAVLRRLQCVMMFKELRFSLGDIRQMLDDPTFDERKALTEQIRLLEAEKKRLDGLIRLARDAQKKRRDHCAIRCV